MFADSLLESPWSDRSRRGWTTLLSFTAQVFGVGVLLAIPLLYTEGLPTLKLIAAGAPLMAPPEPPHVSGSETAAGGHASNTLPPLVVRPNFHPIGLPPVEPVGNEPPACSGCLPGAEALQPGYAVPGSIGNAPPPLPAAPKPASKPLLVSHMMEGNLIYQVQPKYPALARSARVQGAVVMRAIISRAGTIENLQVLSGHPLLNASAIEAVRQWRYRPYILNGDPVEVETQVTVNFILAAN